MRIFHISDTHIGSPGYFNEEILEDLISEINSGDFDIVIHTGDITQGGGKREYEKARKFMKKIKIPFIVLPGNHDARSGGIHLFERYIGPANGVLEVGDAVIIYVNSAVADSNRGRVGMVKFNMLKNALDNYSEKPIKIVALHHHILPIPRAGRERNVLSNAGDMLELIRRADVDLVLLGHRHYPNVYNVDSTVFINAGTASSTKTRYGDINSYSIIEIEPDLQRVINRRVDGTENVHEYSRKEKRIFSNFGERKFRLIHLSNTFISEVRDFQKNHFQNAMDTIRELDADLVVHCGGVVKDGIQQDYELARKYLGNIEIPILFTPAGRDINYLGYRLFRDYFGPFDQFHSASDMIFQGVSSAQYDSTTGVIGETERKALLDKMRDREEGFQCIFLHHNLVPIPHSREKGLLEDSGDLLREIVDENIDLVLTGTSSHPYAVRVEKTLIVNANSLSSIYQRSLFGNSFNVIDIYENLIAVFEINSLWGKRRVLGIWEINHKS